MFIFFIKKYLAQCCRETMGWCMEATAQRSIVSKHLDWIIHFPYKILCKTVLELLFFSIFIWISLAWQATAKNISQKRCLIFFFLTKLEKSCYTVGH